MKNAHCFSFKRLLAFNEPPSTWLQATRKQALEHTLNLLPSLSTEFGLYDDRLFGELSLPQNFAVAQLHHVSDRSSSSLVLGSICPCLLTDVGPSTDYQRWQLGRSSSSCLSGDASCPLLMGDICQSSSCGDAASIISSSWVLPRRCLPT